MVKEVDVDFKSLINLNIIVKDLENEIYDLNRDLSINLEDLTEEEIESKLTLFKVSINALISNFDNVKKSVLGFEGRRMFSEE